MDVCMHVSMDVNMGTEVVMEVLMGMECTDAWMRGWVWISVDGSMDGCGNASRLSCLCVPKAWGPLRLVWEDEGVVVWMRVV